MVRMNSSWEDEDYLVYLETMVSEDMAGNGEQIDFDYENFLHHVREDGKSYIFESVDPYTGLPISVKYESCGDADDARTRRNVGEFDDDKRNFRANVGRGRTVNDRGGLNAGDFDDGKHNFQPNVGRGRNVNDRGAAAVKPRFNSCVEEELYDESYQYFISRAKRHGDSVVLDLGNGQLVEYEIDVDPDDLAGGEAQEESPGRSCDESLSFQERLMGVLSKPYSHQEHGDLWKKVSCRTGEQQGRNLRSREVTFDIGKPGKSYLDYYPEFAAKLIAAGQVKQLELLRGFFFWMQNLCTEGAYQPWLKSSNQHAPVQVVADDCAMLPAAEATGPEIVDVLDN